MSPVAEEKDVYRASFERFAASGACSTDPTWLRERRAAAFARFVEKGFPGPRDEAWRHTPIAPLTRTRFEPADPATRVSPALLAAAGLDGFHGPQVVLVNGRLSRELSTLDSRTPGVEVLSLREALQTQPARLEPHLGRLAAGEASAFADLNTAFAEDGAVIRLAPGATLAEPVHVAHLSAGDGAPCVSWVRTLVVAGRGSECRLVESYAGSEGGTYLVNAVTEVVIEDNASVDHYHLQKEGAGGLHVATLTARLGRDARFCDHAVTFGAALSRRDIDVRFEAEGGDCVLNGLFVLDGERFADTHSRIDHAKPHCSSRQLYKGVLDGASRGVFNGLVVVRPGAQKTDAWQMNKNLLLSRQALVHSTPQLEILADDVKCKHGSTTGQLDPTALFYLRSRGIGEAAARSLLTYAFASDLVQRLEVEPLRRAVGRHLQAHLPGPDDLREAMA
jgi:Fe-S cluster assembly protein SufD